jgi:hypothetical protein
MFSTVPAFVLSSQVSNFYGTSLASAATLIAVIVQHEILSAIGLVFDGCSQGFKRFSGGFSANDWDYDAQQVKWVKAEHG